MNKRKEMEAHLGHALSCFEMGASGGMSIYLFASDSLEQADELGAQRIFDNFVIISSNLRGRGDVGGKLDFADRGDESDDLNAVDELQVLFGNGTSSNTTDSLAGTATSSSAACLDTILLKVGPVGVAGARIEIGLRVVPGALVFILDKKTNRSAESDAVLDARLKLNKIFLIALSKMISWAKINVKITRYRQNWSLREWSGCSGRDACD